MSEDGHLLFKLVEMQRDILSSLRLKDVLDTVAANLSNLANQSRAAIFLLDSDSAVLKLMAAKGYSDQSLSQMRLSKFTDESILKFVLEKRAFVSCLKESAPTMSARIMNFEDSQIQIALPLISCNFLLGCVLLEFSNTLPEDIMPVLQSLVDTIALNITHAIVFGLSEYKREQLNTLYKSLCALNDTINIGDVLRIATDAALILGNTPNCALLLYDAQQESFNLAAFKGLDGSTLNEFNLSTRHTIAGASLKTGKCEYVGEDGRTPYGLPKSTGGSNFGSVLALPLIHDHKPLGVLELFSIESQGFDAEQIGLLESFAKQVSVALSTTLTHKSNVLQAIQDAHTGVYNRAQFEKSLAQEVDRSRRHRHELAVLLIDLDHLGQVNERLGHQFGDQAIRHVARVIKETLRDIDVVCRYGGEEFAALLPETSASASLEVAERLRNNIAANNLPDLGQLTASIGVAAFPGNSEQPAGLMQSAEQALDVAKFQGRNRVIVSLAPQSSPLDAIAWTDLVKQARLAVNSERQSRLRSRLSITPPFTGWLHGSTPFVKKESGRAN
jgi:diguanylate cyclase (GGDEF)-like protein